jgi:uncharacterized glyoxalase superfamily protein PhnB
LPTITAYIIVRDAAHAADWYAQALGAERSTLHQSAWRGSRAGRAVEGTPPVLTLTRMSRDPFAAEAAAAGARRTAGVSGATAAR